MRKTLTELSVRNLPIPEKGQRDYWDTLPGFGVRVSQGGSKTFIVLKHGNRTTIGRYPLVSLQEARHAAKRVLLQSTLVSPRLSSTAFPEAVQRYLQARGPELRPRTLLEYRRILGAAPFHGLVEDISQADIANALDAIPGQQSKSHTYAAYKTFFNWCIERQYCDANPLARIKKPRTIPKNERVLSDDELTAVWKACDTLGTFGAIVRLCIITGQRKGQFAALEASWVDYDKKLLTFPASVMKGKREHTIPMPTLAEYVIRCDGNPGRFTFSPPGYSTPFSAWSKNKAKLDRMVPIDPWDVHDLRRTWSTNAARLHVPPHIIERVLAHVQPEGKVAAIYNRFRYEADMRDALNRMNTHILQLITP